MEEQNQEMSPEQFKLRVLKQRFAERLADAEETISELITVNQQQRQHIEQLEGQLNAETTEATTDDEG